mgnify:CR=1 FL=1
MTTKTKMEIKQKPSGLSVKSFCDYNEIPYLIKFMETILDEEGKKKKVPKNLPEGWTDLTYDECMELNKKKVVRANSLIINLEDSDYFIVDIDNKKIIPEIFKQTGNEWYSESFTKKLPHLWRQKVGDEVYKASQHKEYGMDIITNVLFERLDGVFKNTEGNGVPKMKRNHIVIPESKVVIKKKKMKIKNEIKIKTNNEEDKKFTEELYEDTLKQISPENREILDNIEDEYWTNYGDWIKLIWALNNCYGDIELCDYYSKKGSNYKGIEDVKKFLNMDKQKTLTFGTLAYYSKISNEEGYNFLRQKYNKLDDSDFGLSKTFLSLIEDDIIKHNGELYIYKHPFWIKDEKCNMVLLEIRKRLIKFYRQLKQYFNKKQEEIEDTESPEYLLIEKHIQKISDIIIKVSTYAKKKAILSEIEITLEDKDFKMDLSSPNLFAFSCGTIWNVKSKQIVKTDKYDYISIHTGYPWAEPTQKQICLVRQIINEIMPNEDVRRCYLSILKQTINADTCEYFVLFNGSGCNGKGWTVELLKEMLNNYFCKANKDLLVSKQKTGANPELMALDNKRAVIFSEPDEGEKIKSDFMKDISGGEKITGRGLYQNAKEINVKCGVKIMECNQRPGLSGTNSEAFSRRIIDILFSITLTDNVDKVKKNPGKYMLKNSYYKTDEFKLDHKCALFMLLMECEDEKIFKPKCVVDRGKEYLMGNDELFTWFKDNYEITDDEKTDIIAHTQIYEEFKKSDFYKTLSSKEKRTEWSKSGLESKIKMNPELEDYWRDIAITRTKAKGMVGIKLKEKETEAEQEFLNDDETSYVSSMDC